MLPTPVSIIKTKRLYIPIAYVLATLVLCHIFITCWVSPQSLQQQQSQIPEKKSNRVYRSVLKLNSNLNSNSKTQTQNVSRRSNSTKVRIGDQDERIKEAKDENLAKVMDDGENENQEGNVGCKKFKIGFAEEHTFKPRALVSFPGSGNSWLRHLIESSTGIYTGSIYNDKILFQGGFLGESRPPNDGSTIVQKTHHFSTISSSKEKLQAYVKLSELMFGYRGILLIRNPYDALVSFWNLRSTRTHMGHASESSYSTPAWKTFVERGSQVWADLAKDWIEKSMDLQVVLYEDLKTNTEKELAKILKYLKLPNDPERFKCTIKNKEGSFHRKRQWKEVATFCGAFTTKDISENLSLDLLVQKNIKKLNSFLFDYGFPLQLNYTGSNCFHN